MISGVLNVRMGFKIQRDRKKNLWMMEVIVIQWDRWCPYLEQLWWVTEGQQGGGVGAAVKGAELGAVCLGTQGLSRCCWMTVCLY